MTEQSRHWDGVSLGDATLAPYSASEWADQERLEHGQGSIFPNYGILSGTGDGTYSPLRVQAKSPASTNIEVEIGVGLVHGYLYENTTALTLAVGSNASGNPRIDTVVLRADIVAQTVRAAIKQGTPAGSPVHPTLTQSTTIWEIPLADIAVANGFSVINQTDITNRQRSIQDIPKGWLPVVYPIGYIAGGNYTLATAGLNAGGGAVAIPFIFDAPMLIHEVTVYGMSGLGGMSLEWGLYHQDVNEGNTAENTVRLLANGSGSDSSVTTRRWTLAATPAPQPVSSGLHWLVIRNSGGSSFGIGRIAASAFEQDLALTKVTIAAIAQTLDLVTSWSGLTDHLAAAVKGRVLGQTTVF